MEISVLSLSARVHCSFHGTQEPPRSLILGGQPECSRWEQGKTPCDTESGKGLGPLDNGNQCPGVEARKDQGSEFQGDSNSSDQPQAFS
ncbi:hypothetical protein D4Z77_08845, partial [Campylobacter coli]